MEKIGDKIYNLRKEKGLSQEVFSDDINIARQTISKWERNEVEPSFSSLKRISEYFGIDVNYFLNDIELSTARQTAISPTIIELPLSAHERDINEMPIEEEPPPKKQSLLKTLLIVTVSVLLVYIAIACGIVFYVYAIVPGDDVNVNSVNYVGLSSLIIGTLALSYVITIIIFQTKKRESKNQKNK